MAKLAETSPGVMFTILHKPDGTACMPYVSPRIEELNGLSPEILAEDLSGLYAWIHPEDVSRVLKSIEDSASALTTWHEEFRVRHPVKGEVWVEGRSTPVSQLDGSIQCFGFFHDITERKCTEKLLHNNREQLAAMATKLSLAEERERRRIAAVLHDHIGQILLLSKIKLETLAEGKDDDTYHEIQELLAQAINDVRSLTQELNPPLLAEVGLEAAIYCLAKKMKADYSLSVDFCDDGSTKPLSEELRAVLYQSARELLINVAKHAGTRDARLTIGREGDVFTLIVDDQGGGFACPDTNVHQESSFGLFNVRQRIKHLGGEMKIESEPGRGTCVTIRVPLTDG
jgi:PAS domain S-box-containing protein